MIDILCKDPNQSPWKIQVQPPTSFTSRGHLKTPKTHLGSDDVIRILACRDEEKKTQPDGYPKGWALEKVSPGLNMAIVWYLCFDFWGVHDFFSRGSLNQKKTVSFFFLPGCYPQVAEQLDGDLRLAELRAAAFAVVLSAFANEPMAHKTLQKWTARAVGRRLAAAPWCDATTPPATSCWVVACKTSSGKTQARMWSAISGGTLLSHVRLLDKEKLKGENTDCE